jgi:hypothetical protein
MHFCLGYVGSVGSMTKKDFMIYMTILPAYPDVQTFVSSESRATHM